MHHVKILVTTASTPRSDGLQRTDSVTGANYSQAVALAGGLPLMAPNLDPGLATVYAQECDGIVFSGGVDIAPAHFGQEPKPGLGRVSSERDRFELALYHAARKLGRPVLGICRGIQLVNVAEGGTLHQHLPDLPHALQHEQADSAGDPIHSVRLEEASRLARALYATKLQTNSFHHQAIDRLGSNLRAVAWAADGIVEAVEEARGSFVLAVQWHPEMSFLGHAEHLKPFELLLDAAMQAQSASLRS